MRIMRLCGILLGLSLLVCLSICQSEPSQPVSAQGANPALAGEDTILRDFKWQDADVDVVVRAIGEQSGLNIIINGGVKETITA